MHISQKLIFSLALIRLAVPAAAGSLYVVNGSGQFGTVDLAGGAFHQIGPTMMVGAQGLVSGAGSSLFSLDFAGNLITINPATGGANLIGPAGFADCSVPPASPCGPHSSNSLASIDGKLFATDFTNNLYSVDPVTGAATLIGLTGIPAVPFTPTLFNADGSFNFFDEGLFAANGSLYATFDAGTFNPVTLQTTEVIEANLYRIDPVTAIAMLVGPTQFNLGAVTGMNGTYYGFVDGRSKIVTLDLSSGSTTDIGDFDPAAGIVTGAAATPEPTSIALTALGLAGLTFAKYRKCSLRRG